MNMICIILSWYVSIVAPESSASRIHTTEMDLRNESPQMSLSEPKPEAAFIFFTEINHSEDFCLEDKLSEDQQAASWTVCHLSENNKKMLLCNFQCFYPVSCLSFYTSFAILVHFFSFSFNYFLFCTWHKLYYHFNMNIYTVQSADILNYAISFSIPMQDLFIDTKLHLVNCTVTNNLKHN